MPRQSLLKCRCQGPIPTYWIRFLEWGAEARADTYIFNKLPRWFWSTDQYLGNVTTNHGQTNNHNPATDSTIQPLIPHLTVHVRTIRCVSKMFFSSLPGFAGLIFPHLPIISRCATNLDTFALASSLVVLFSTRESEWTYRRQSKANITGEKRASFRQTAEQKSRKKQKGSRNFKIKLLLMPISYQLSLASQTVI